jgi:hypothetical protein
MKKLFYFGVVAFVLFASDHSSFFAFERPDPATRFLLRDDSLVAAGQTKTFQ